VAAVIFMKVLLLVFGGMGRLKKYWNWWPVLLGLLLPAAPAGVQAQPSGSYGPYNYMYGEGGVIITFYNGTTGGGTANIPAYIANQPVIGFGNVFVKCASLTNVTIPGTVTNIPDSAFYQCANLASVTISNGVPGIGGNAFEYCTSLTNVTIPSSVISFTGGAFYECSSLPCVTIPGCVTNFGGGMFYGCGSLTNFIIPAGTTIIEGEEFYGCAKLSSMTIPASVTNIQDAAFWNCTGLSNVYFLGNAPIVDGSVFSGDPNVMLYYLPGAIGFGTSFYASLPSSRDVLWNPLIQTGAASVGVQNSQFGFNITGTNSFTVVVEACTNLANPVWTPLQTVTLINGSFYFTDPQWMNYPSRFYGLGMP
jgi:hypothetical protein